MRVQFLLGPAGSGKTFRCLADIRARLIADPLGPPLILLAPRQATYQLEAQLLAEPELAGYTRLQIVAFERFAAWLLEQLAVPPQAILSEEGRVMVLRALLHRHHGELQAFGASGRAAGFAGLLSEQLRELQQHRVTPAALRESAGRVGAATGLQRKLHDLALLLEHYEAWLKEQGSPDAGTLIEHAIEALKRHARERQQGLHIAGLWLDGAAELTPQELELLAAVMPFCDDATLAFCLESEPREEPSWLSTWAVISQTCRRCRARLEVVDGCEITTTVIRRDEPPTRFRASADQPPAMPTSHRGRQISLFDEGSGKAAPAPASSAGLLAALEAGWTGPGPAGPMSGDETAANGSLALLRCNDPEHEAVAAAREVLAWVQAGHRYRDCAVLLRQLDSHYAGLRRVFTRYGIPFFLDRRESVAHHPLAQLTRGALHTVQFHWRFTDWFSTLKSGLAGLTDPEVDELENAALAHGWEGVRWQNPLLLRDEPELARRCERLRTRVLPPFLRLRDAVGGSPTGGELARALRELWTALDVEGQLQTWATGADARKEASGATHLTVLDELHGWLDNLELAFHDVALPLREWLPVLETGLTTLTVGVIPPAIDQVLIGAVDRSRNPDLQLAIVLGLNEGNFPRAGAAPGLLADYERVTLEDARLNLGGDRRLRLGHERYLGYIACTRARQRLVLAWSDADASGRPLNPSSFIDHVRRLFPFLGETQVPAMPELADCRHPAELLTPLLQDTESAEGLRRLPVVSGWLQRFAAYDAGLRRSQLSPAAVQQLHGQRLKVSASRLEEFAACPFKYFVNASLRARERDRFEVDARKTGTFNHEVLRQFHEELVGERLRWRDITPADARQRIARIATEQQQLVADGVLASHPRHVFATASLTALLQDFVATVVEWMSTYQFDPLAVELSLGGSDADLPWWEIDLGEGRTLAFRGSVDRVDAAASTADAGDVYLTVIDYKSGQKSFDELKLQAGLQLQLPAYLAALCAVADGGELLGGRRAVPAGMFYVRLRGPENRTGRRDDSRPADRGFKHTGRFSFELLPLFDRASSAGGSGQFSYRLKNDGQPYGNSKELVPQEKLAAMTRDAGAMLRHMGREILAGRIAVDPYRKGSDLACTWCAYQSVCRIDRWTHAYRPLQPLLAVADDSGAAEGDDEQRPS